jgi:hypothetical protein
MKNHPVQVTLVHGTWATRSRWPLAGSPLRTALENAGAECHEFRWTGRNSHAARTRAAQQLPDHLRKVKGDTGGQAAQAIVAHSHGGNAAVHAAWGLLGNQGGKTIKVVSLATPFFFARLRGSVSILNTIFAPIMGALAVALYVEVNLIRHRHTHGALVGAMAGLLLIALIVQGASWLFFSATHESSSPDSMRATVVDTIQTPTIPAAESSNEFLVIRAADDEAGGVLGFAQFSGWLALRANQIARPGVVVVVVTVLMYAAALAPNVLRDLLPDWLSLLIIHLVVPTLISLALLASAPAVVAIATGWDGPAVSRFAVVTAEASPPGDCAVWQLGIRERRAGGFSHSSLYDDPEVIQRIVGHLLSGNPRGAS